MPLPSFPALTSLTAGGALTPSASSRSGDASAGLDAPWQYNAAFQVGGSGSQSQSQSADQSAGQVANEKVVVYIALGLLGAVALAAVIK